MYRITGDDCDNWNDVAAHFNIVRYRLMLSVPDLNLSFSVPCEDASYLFNLYNASLYFLLTFLLELVFFFFFVVVVVFMLCNTFTCTSIRDFANANMIGAEGLLGNRGLIWICCHWDGYPTQVKLFFV